LQEWFEPVHRQVHFLVFELPEQFLPPTDHKEVQPEPDPLQLGKVLIEREWIRKELLWIAQPIKKGNERIPEELDIEVDRNFLKQYTRTEEDDRNDSFCFP